MSNLKKDFYSLSNNFLLEVANQVENQDVNSNLDIEYFDGVLNIKINSTSKTYVINRHSASEKIWYSSPFSGADYFSFDEKSSKWINTKNEELLTKLISEINQKND